MKRWITVTRDDRWPEPDLTKPNHYYWDSLGDPYNCDEDHNHPPKPVTPTLERVVEIAAFLVGVGVVLLILLGVYTLSDLVL